MPPRKRYVRQVKVNLAGIELAYLSWLDKNRQKGLSDLVRAAIREQMSRLSERDVVAFQRFADGLRVRGGLDMRLDDILRSELKDFFGPQPNRTDESMSTTFAVLPPLGEGETERIELIDDQIEDG